MKDLKPKPPQIESVYRNIGYKLTATGMWIYNYPSPVGGVSWDRFLTDDEVHLLLDRRGDRVEQEKAMQNGIDRAFTGQIVYRGNIRDRYYA